MPTLQDSVRRAMRIAPSKVRAQDFRDPHETVYLFVHRKECSRCQQYKQSPRKKKYESGQIITNVRLYYGDLPTEKKDLTYKNPKPKYTRFISS